MTIRKNHLFYMSVSLLLALLYITTGLWSLKLLSGENIISLGVFAPEGIALAFALYFGKRVVFGIFLGQFILALLNHINYTVALEISFSNTIEALIAIWLFDKFKLNKKLSSLRDIVGLISIIVFVLQPFSAFFGNMVMYLHGDVTKDIFLSNMFSWWFGNVMGQLLYTPALLLLFTRYNKIDFIDYIIVGTLFGIYEFILIFVIVAYNPFILLIFNIPLTIYIIANKGIIYGTLLSIILSVITSISIYKGIVVFGTNNYIFENILNYNLFVLLHTLIVLFVGILLEERKRSEEELQKKIEKALEKNKEQQLLIMQQSRLAQMGELISMIAHQWRQPLNNLSLLNHILLTQYKKGKLDDKSIEYFKTNSKRQINMMSTTIDDFRNFFKSDKSRIKFDIKDTIEKTIKMTQPIYDNKNIKIELITDPKSNYETEGFPNELAQVVLNIINNAKDALIENMVENKRVTIKLIELDEYIEISIEDNAGGIDSSIIENIFDPYFSTKEKKDGTGLGLYMSKMIIEDHFGATIDVRNSQDGAVFVIRIAK